MGVVCLSKLLFLWYDLRLSVFVAECFYYLLLSVARAVLWLAAPADYPLRCYLIIVRFIGVCLTRRSKANCRLNNAFRCARTQSTFDILKTNNKKRTDCFSQPVRLKVQAQNLQERREIHRHANGFTVAGVILCIEQYPLADT